MSYLKIIDQMRDPYERKARITPGLLTMLPLMVPLLCTYGPKHPILTSLITLFAGCGVIYALGNIARGRGKLIEEKLVLKWGGMPTTICLRHSDHFLERYTKQRYRELIKAKLNIDTPTELEEQENPSHADDVYRSVARRLRELTRENKSLLLKENISYGFHRNMLGMKPIGIMTSLIGLIYFLIITKTLSVEPVAFDFLHLLTPGLSGVITLAISVSLLISWIFYFNEAAVKRIGFVYSERLFESLNQLPTPRKKSQKRVED
jgi:hypothetical protein